MDTEAQIPVSATIAMLPDGVRVAFFAVEADVRAFDADEASSGLASGPGTFLLE